MSFIIFFPLKWGKGGRARLLYFWWKNTKEGTIFKGGRVNHPWMKLWYRGKEVLINKV